MTLCAQRLLFGWARALLCGSAILFATASHNAIGNEAIGSASEGDFRRAFGSKQVQFNIPPGPLESALQQWARASNLKLLAPSEHLRAANTEGLSGVTTP